MADVNISPALDGDEPFRLARGGIVWVTDLIGYSFFVDNTDVRYAKTTDGGVTWGSPVDVKVATIRKLDICYDQWVPGDVGTEIHMAYFDEATADYFYRSLDTADDTLGTEVTVSTSGSDIDGNWQVAYVLITKSQGGNFHFLWRNTRGASADLINHSISEDGGLTWQGAKQVPFVATLANYGLLMPGNDLDPDDVRMIYWNVASGNLEFRTYDFTGDSWDAATIIDAAVTPDAGLMNLACTIRPSDGNLFVTYWTQTDNAAADMKTVEITGAGAFTARTDVLTNQSESGGCAVTYHHDSQRFFGWYLRGGTWGTSVQAYFKISNDGMVTWGPEQSFSETAGDLGGIWADVLVTGRGRAQGKWFDDTGADLETNRVNSLELCPLNFPISQRQRPRWVVTDASDVVQGQAF